MAVSAIIDVLKPSSELSNSQDNDARPQHCALIYVWALEQKHSRRGWDEGDAQDVMVPWVMRQKKADNEDVSETFNRYYHLYRQGELEQDIQAAGGEVVESGYEKDNWWAIAIKKRPS